MFRQVVGTLFSLMSRYEKKWKEAKGSQSTAMYGEPIAVEPEPVPVTLSAMMEKLRAGAEEHEVLWQRVLTAENLAAVKEIAALSDEDYRFPADRWARIVFDFAVAFNKSGLEPAEVIGAMTPLYYGRTAGLVKQSQEMSTAQFEQQVIQTQAQTFEKLKPYLIERWESRGLEIPV
jgi:hypothetical protein